MTLDPDQQAAVDHREGACLVLAGPGSGKTRVIVERFLALFKAGCDADEQLVLTYTVRAAEEMRSRAEALHGPFAGMPPLLNFHSFSRQVLREWGFLVGLPPGFRVADEAERRLHLAAVLEEARPRTLWNPLRPFDMVGDLLELFEKAKQELVAPERYAQWATERLGASPDDAERALLERHAECAEVYARLGARFARRGVLDHDDCILLAERLLREDAAARRAVCDRLRFLMVDEFQDTNLAQARLVETVCAGHDNILAVADDDQSIYKFRGASLANLERFAERHPEHRTITLGRNYRSTPQIVATCRALIESATAGSRRPKTVVATRSDGPAVECWASPDARSEALAVARWCAEHSAAGGRLDAVAWLFHRHEDMRPAMAALRELGVAYRVSGGRGFFTSPEIKDLQALLLAVADPGDSQSLVRLLHLPPWRVGGPGRLALVRAAGEDPRPLLDRLRVDAELGALLSDETDAAAARRCADDLVALHAESLHADVRELVFDAVERSGFLGVDELADPVQRIQAGANLGKLAELLEAFAEWSDDIRLVPALGYLEALRESRSADDIAAVDQPGDGVELLTAHSAKGLEWPVVVVARCIDRRWPGRPGFSARLRLPDELVDEPAPQGDERVDEERRLFYVAMTRARDRLVLSRALRYPDSYRDAEPPARFLEALGSAGEAAPLQVSQEFVPPSSAARRRVAGAAAAAWPRPGVGDLRDFADCPRRYAYRRRWRMPARPRVQRWYGTLVHATLERAGRLRCAGAAIDAEALAALWAAAWEARPGPKGAHPELRGFGEQTLRAYAATPAWTSSHPIAVEQPFVVLAGPGEIGGRFDRVDAAREAPPTVVDYKTGPPRSAESTARDLQVRAYAVALAQQEGVEEVAVELHHLQTAEVVRVGFDARALGQARNHVEAVAGRLAEAGRSGRFPANAADWRCRACDFRTICDEGSAASDT